MNLAISLGLGRYEARAYLALLELGEVKAAQIAAASGVPRGRIYEVLQSLHEKGLVTCVSATPLRYRPTPLADFTERRKRELAEEAAALERRAEALASQVQVRPLPSRTGNFLLYRKRGPVAGKVREVLQAARKEVWISNSEGCTIRLVKLHLSAIREKAKEGVDIRISTNITPASQDPVRRLAPFATIRHNPLANRGVTIVVTDVDQAMICHWNPDDDDPFEGDDAALWSTDPGVVAAFRSIVQDAWARGVDAAPRLRELKTGRPPEKTEVLSRLEAIGDLIPAAARAAQQEIQVSVATSVVEAASAPEFEPLIEALSSQPVAKRMLVAHDRPTLQSLRRFAESGFDVRIAQSPSLEQFLLVDGAEVFAPLWRAPSATAGSKTHLCARGDLVVRSNASAVVAGLAEVFQAEWERATPLEEAGVSEKAAAPPVSTIPN